MIDTDKYEKHTITGWCARNIGDGSTESCDNDYDHDKPFIETDNGMGDNPAIGYFVGGREAHSLEEKRANIRLMADAPLILADYKRLQERLDWILGDEELAGYVWEKEVAYMEHEGVRLPWISADEWGEEE